MTIFYGSFQGLSDALENVWLKQWKGMLLGAPVHDDDRHRLLQAVESAAAALGKLDLDFDPHLLEVSTFRYLRCFQMTNSTRHLTDACLFVAGRPRCRAVAVGRAVRRCRRQPDSAASHQCVFQGGVQRHQAARQECQQHPVPA